jgi:hypothetical protein
MTDDDWQIQRQETGTRLGQLDEELDEALGRLDPGYALPDDPVAMLQAIMARRAQAEVNVELPKQI